MQALKVPSRDELIDSKCGVKFPKVHLLRTCATRLKQPNVMDDITVYDVYIMRV